MQRRGVDDHRRGDGSRRRALHLRVALALAIAAAPAFAVDSADAAEAPTAPPVRFGALVVVDTLRVDTPAFTTALGHVDLRLDGDAGRLLGWTGTTFRLEALADYGGKPNGRVGSVQGLSNIEVRRNATRLYAAWLQHALSPEVDVLAGLYDLNSEFYATDASSMLIHPAFGVGAELAQTGRNGPSIFPDLAAGVRVRARVPGGAYGQAAVLAASAGDPDHPGRSVVRVNRRDGALVVAEAGWQASGPDDDGVARAGMGLWRYSEPVDRLDGRGRATNAGAYVLGQASLGRMGGQRIDGFARAGFATASVDPIAFALDAGVRGQRTRAGAGPDAWSAGVAFARLGRDAIAARTAQGEGGLHRTESTFEVSARWQLGAGLAVQPVVQHVLHVAGRRHSTSIVGVRWLWNLPGGDE